MLLSKFTATPKGAANWDESGSATTFQRPQPFWHTKAWVLTKALQAETRQLT